MEKTQKNKLETASIGKLMLELCTQTTFSIMLFNIYTITDTLFVSKGVGSVASGAIGIFSPVLVLIGGISSTLGAGGGSIISRKLGEKDQTNAKAIVGCIMWIWLLCSLVITITGIVLLKPLLYLLGCTAEIYPYAVQYGRIILLSTVISTGFSGIMRAEGDILFSTLQWSFPVIINIALNPLFIFAFDMGITGTALATLVAQLFSAGTSAYYFFIRRSTPCRIGLRDIRWNWKISREILYIGVPALLSSFGGSFIGIAWNHVLNQVGGTLAISTFAIISRIQGFLATPFTGVMQGIQPILGFEWGRQEIKRVKRTVFYAGRFNLIYGVLIAVCCYFGAERILTVFTSNAEIISMGKGALKIICISFAASGIIPIVQAYFQAIGNGKKMLLLSLCSIFIIRLPLLFISRETMNLAVMWWTYVFGDVLTAGWSVYEYLKFQKGARIHGELNEK